MARTGRPSKYTPELAEEICFRISEGKGLSQALREMEKEPEWPNCPAYRTVMVWLWDGKHEDFVRNYARAREAQAHYDADTIREIAGELRHCRTRDESDGLDKLAKNYQWLAGKHAPKVYGDLTKLEHTGGGGGPVQITLVRGKPPEADTDEG